MKTIEIILKNPAGTNRLVYEVSNSTAELIFNFRDEKDSIQFKCYANGISYRTSISTRDIQRVFMRAD